MIQQTIDREEIGRLGEEAAVKRLRQAGYEICARNWRSGSYELDIVARRYDTLHIIEVKTRQADALTTPEDALTVHKIRSLHHAARIFMGVYARRYEGYEVQFDLAKVVVDSSGAMQVDLVERVADFNW